MRDYLFLVNKKNASKLQEEFSFNEYDKEYIYRSFWPIIVLTDIPVKKFQELLNQEKNNFITKRKKFVVEIFKRDYLNFLIYELNEYLDHLKRGKNKIYDRVNDTYFHWFVLKHDNSKDTLLLSNKDETDLEIYFIDLLKIIELFIMENETHTTTPKAKPQLGEYTNSQKEFILSMLPPQTIVKQESEQIESELSKKFKNNFDNVSEPDIYNHFNKLVQKKMLTDEELIKFLIQAFQEVKPPKEKFKFKNIITKGKLRSYFYNYYNEVAQHPHNKKDDYVKLLTDYFEGYKFETTKSNFSK